MAKDFKVKIRLDGDAKGADRAIKKTQKSFSGMVSKLKVGALAVTAALASMLGAYKALEAAGERLGQKRALERALNADGIAIDDFVDKLKELSNNQIATSDIILASNRAIALGISKDDIPGLLEAATKASVALGVTASKAFQDITTGVGRASPLILDNLGIMIDATRVFVDYAAKIGVATSELTKQQRTAAIAAAAIKGAAKGAEDFASAQSLVTVAIGKAQAALKNFYETQVQSVASSTLLANVVSGTTAEMTLYAAAVRGTIRALGDLIPAQEKSKQGFINTDLLLKSLPLGMGDFSKAVHIYGEEVLAAEAKQEKLRLGLLAADKAFNSAREGVEDLADAKSELAKIEEEGLARRKRIEAGLLAEADAMAKLGDALGIVTASQLEEEARAIEDALQDARDATLGFSQELSDLEESASRELASLALRTQSVKDGLGDMGKAAADAALGFTKAAVAIDKTGDAVDDTGDSFDDLSRSVRNTNSALSDQARQAQATGRELTHLTAISETLALAEARTALAATKEARKNITGVGSQNRDNSTGKYGLSEFGTGGRVRVNPDGTLRPA